MFLILMTNFNIRKTTFYHALIFLSFSKKKMNCFLSLFNYKMSVINVKVKNIRPEYENLKEWMKNDNNVYIGRKGVVFIDGKRFPSTDSIWCNPYKIDKNNNRNDVIIKYKQYIVEKIKNENLHDELKKLHNKTLGCWCYPEACHGDKLRELICSMC